jgi:ribosome-associated protein
VNRSETQVELLFDVTKSPSLTEDQRDRVLHRLRGYIDSRGVLHLTSQNTRSQRRNREQVIERFRNLMDEGLHVRRKRIATKPSRGAKETRLRRKRRRSLVKRLRRKPSRDE